MGLMAVISPASKPISFTLSPVLKPPALST